MAGLHGALPQIASGVWLSVTALVLASATVAAAWLYDAPLRRWLMARWRARRRSPRTDEGCIRREVGLGVTGGR